MATSPSPVAAAPTISNITGLPTTVAAADTSFTLTISAALTAPPTIAYDQNSADAKIIKDKAGKQTRRCYWQSRQWQWCEHRQGLDLAATDDTGVNTDNITKNTSDLTIYWLCEGGQHGDAVEKRFSVLTGRDGHGGWVHLYERHRHRRKKSGVLTLTSRHWQHRTLSRRRRRVAAVLRLASTAMNITVDTIAPTVTAGSTGYYYR